VESIICGFLYKSQCKFARTSVTLQVERRAVDALRGDCVSSVVSMKPNCLCYSSNPDLGIALTQRWSVSERRYCYRDSVNNAVARLDRTRFVSGSSTSMKSLRSSTDSKSSRKSFFRSLVYFTQKQRSFCAKFFWRKGAFYASADIIVFPGKLWCPLYPHSWSPLGLGLREERRSD
jgi:hypothetical protein